MSNALAERLTVVTLAERPELRDRVFGPEIQSALPEFMRHDPAASLYYGGGRLDHFLDYALTAIDPVRPEIPVARAFAVPFAFCDGRPERAELPDGGWDAVIRWADDDRHAGRPATAVSALEIMVAPDRQRGGIARRMLAAMRDNARRLGFRDLYAPLRPTLKDREPLTPFAEYVARRRADGQAWDPWLRLHLRAGARIVKIAPCSVIIAGTLAEWSRWTGVAFERSGETVVPGALSPVRVSREQDHAVYVEPNLWLHHRV